MEGGFGPEGFVGGFGAVVGAFWLEGDGVADVLDYYAGWGVRLGGRGGVEGEGTLLCFRRLVFLLLRGGWLLRMCSWWCRLEESWEMR